MRSGQKAVRGRGNSLCRTRGGAAVSGCAYYNEFDPQKAAWLPELILRGCIAPGDVDERSIHDVRPDDVRGYRQCHFLAGIAVWSCALRLAGWPDDREVWTGSCPCQPFSDAGKKEAFDGLRHLWPVWFPLIEARRPLVLFGEQVASADGLAWFDAVYFDLDHDLCGACVGAPHRRQRLFWVADTDGGSQGRWAGRSAAHVSRRLEDLRSASAQYRKSFVLADDPSGGCGIGWDAALQGRGRYADGGSDAGELGDSRRAGLEEWGRQPGDAGPERQAIERTGAIGIMAAADGWDASAEGLQRSGEYGLIAPDGGDVPVAGPVNGFWRDCDWVLTRPQRVGYRPCLRPVEAIHEPLADGPASDLGRSGYRGFPLAKGEEARVMRLRGYGDGIVAPAAAEFVRAYMGVRK